MTRAEFDADLSPIIIDAAVKAALAEDLGLAGDVTTNSVIDRHARAVGLFATRKPGVVCGLAVAEAAFRALDPKVEFEVVLTDGTNAPGRSTLARVSGNARALLTAERVALNFVGRMSGIATMTREYVDAIAGTKAAIIDTRKTTPGLRAFEKYAVRCGGGMNHRVGLFDAVVIKDNHIAVAGGVDQAISAVRARVGHLVKVQIEVDTLEQLKQVMAHKVDAVLLDNMSPDQMSEAVAMVGGRAIVEASGGITLETLRAIAESGVDVISSGALTHSAKVLDIGLDFEIGG
ncbi:MAG: carboxylating nicotinate-nucleotide diphosphorylase [Hyphomicrobiaceae bacterium]